MTDVDGAISRRTKRPEPAESLRIALVDPSLFTAPYDARLADALSDLGHDVAVYGETRSPGGEPLPLRAVRELFYTELASLRSRRWPRPAIRLAKGALHWRGMKRLVDDLHHNTPDIIHFQWTPLPAVDRLFLPALRRLAPIVLTAHDSLPFNGAAWRLQKWGATGILHEFDGIIVHTEEAYARLTDYGVPPARMVRIPHGLLHDGGPVTARPPQASDRVRFLLFGKLKPYKGADVLIEAFRQLPIDLQNRAEVLIVGEPHMDVAPLLKAAKGLAMGVRVDLRFVPDDEMRELLSSADVIVFPYRQIDISGVLMAALRHGRPIIASHVGGFAELLVDDRHGILVPPGDVAALTRAMARLCREPATRLAMGAAVAELGAETPSWNDIARSTTDLYRAILRSVRTSAPERK
jgi:glycosyltransferase involved in cell wall biosynthesis